MRGESCFGNIIGLFRSNKVSDNFSPCFDHQSPLHSEIFFYNITDLLLLIQFYLCNFQKTYKTWVYVVK